MVVDYTLQGWHTAYENLATQASHFSVHPSVHSEIRYSQACRFWKVASLRQWQALWDEKHPSAGRNTGRLFF